MTRREWIRRSALLGTAATVGCRQQSPDKKGEMLEGQIHPSVEDYATARKGFRTKLTRVAPSPENAEMPSPLGVPGAVPSSYMSGGQPLIAWVNPEVKTPGPRRPAVLFLHGGFAFWPNHWEYARPFLRAGFHVVIPVLRGENGQPGAFSMLYDEVDDCLACASMLSRLPSVEPSRIFVCGHDVGGTLALLCAMASDQFRACAAFSPNVDAKEFLRGRERLAPFDPTGENELRMRSPLYFGPHVFCPVRSFFGTGEGGDVDARFDRAWEMARHARGNGRDVGEIRVAGDHEHMVAPAAAETVNFFRATGGIKY